MKSIYDRNTSILDCEVNDTLLNKYIKINNYYDFFVEIGCLQKKIKDTFSPKIYSHIDTWQSNGPIILGVYFGFFVPGRTNTRKHTSEITTNKQTKTT